MRRFLLFMGLAVIAATATAQDLAVTVYNSNLGVVSETRPLEFDRGIGRLAFRDVPSAIDAASVRFEVIGGNKGVTILEQNYAYDLVSPDKLYAKYVDQQIELIDKNGNLYTGRLLAAKGGSVTLLDKSEKVKVISLGNITEVNFPALPDGLITRPTLFWRYNSSVAGKRDCRVSYQTGGMSWNAEYVGILDDVEKNLDLSGWASITNNSGKTYKEAKLKLIAGNIHRAAKPRPKVAYRMAEASMATDGYAGFEEKKFFEYHLYTLPRPATLANNEIKQISLFEPASTSVKKVYWYRPEVNATAVTVAVGFVNSKQSGLGMPLPAGRVRLFKQDSDGYLILLGEDAIEHTPKDEEIKLTVGTAFDIVAEHKVTNQRRISPTVNEQTYRMEVRNRKDSAVTVLIEKKLYGYWEIMQSSQTYKKKDVNTVQFEVPVPAGDTSAVTLTVRYTSG